MIEIYYFSGTGNSLHVAKELQRRLPESKLIPIVSLLDEDVIGINAEIIVFVFPNFCLTIPIPLYEFLKKVKISSQYIYCICTRGGSVSHAFDYMNEFLKKQGKEVYSGIYLNMCWNLPIGKENLIGVSEDKVKFYEKEIKDKLDLFSKSILAKEKYSGGDSEVNYKLPWSSSVFLLGSKSFNYKAHDYMYQNVVFYPDSKCIQCGTCAKVCPSGKVKMIDDKPVWQKDVKCYGCFACINYCPVKAVQVESKWYLKSFTEKNGRYHHPEISADDIAKQKVNSKF